MTEELFRADSYAKTCEAVVTAVSPLGVELDRTVFYAEGGGQPGDSGVFRLADGRMFAVADTRKGSTPGQILHVPGADAPAIEVGARLVAEIDWARRYRLMRMHSCLHVICSIVPAQITGAGIGEGKGRIDFSLPEQTIDKDAIGETLERLIAANHPLTARWITDDELAARPELVRTMSVKPPTGQGRVRLIEIEGVDLQPCGGTHLRSTGEIGRVRLGKIENKGRHNRRINLAFED